MLRPLPGWDVWAVLDKVNTVCSVFVEKDEAAVWQVFTGRGDESDIRHRKAQGFRVVKIDLSERSSRATGAV